MIKKIIKLNVRVRNKHHRAVTHSVVVDGAARFGSLEATVKNALYGQHDLHTADIISIEYDVRDNAKAAMLDVGA